MKKKMEEDVEMATKQQPLPNLLSVTETLATRERIKASEKPETFVANSEEETETERSW
jgi:hypothetical protein